MQWQHLMDAIRTAEVLTLEYLDISGNYLCDVEPDSLAGAVIAIREVDMRDTTITRAHCQSLVNHIVIMAHSPDRKLQKLFPSPIFSSVIEESVRERIRQVILLEEDEEDE